MERTHISTAKEVKCTVFIVRVFVSSCVACTLLVFFSLGRIGNVHAERWGNMKLLWYGCDQDKYIFDAVYGNLFTHIHIFCLCFSIPFLLRHIPLRGHGVVLQKYIYDVANWQYILFFRRLLFAKFSIPFEKCLLVKRWHTAQKCHWFPLIRIFKYNNELLRVPFTHFPISIGQQFSVEFAR